ncbi:MAG: HAD family hydrolase [Anaerovoracaceae bacterium]
MAIKLIALDLDGTTLTDIKRISLVNKAALEEAMGRGVNVVIATGRTFSALPDDVFDLKGIHYVITSNGAVITDLQMKKPIYENYIHPEAVEETVSILRKWPFMIETFVDGYAYIEEAIYEDMKKTRKSYRHVDYVLNTRRPLKGLYDFILENKSVIENINVNFKDQKDKAMMKGLLGNIPHTTVTSSFDHNLEIGGATTSKADALSHLGEILKVTHKEMMAVGDSPNDIAMMEMAGLPVAVLNAKDEVKKIAAFVTTSNEEDGVAVAVNKFVL